MRIKKCHRCGGSHNIPVEHSVDKAGKARIRYTCPKTGTAWSGYAPKGSTEEKTTTKADKPRRRRTPKEPAMPRQSSLNQPTKPLTFKLPFEVESQPAMEAALDIAEGIVDGLIALHSDTQSLQAQAAAAYQAARGGKNGRTAGDNLEYDLGQHLAKAVQLVLVHRGITQAQWEAMAPPGVKSGARQYMGGAVVDYFVGEEGESGAMGAVGDLWETGAQAVMEATGLSEMGPVGDALSAAAAPVLAEGFKGGARQLGIPVP